MFRNPEVNPFTNSKKHLKTNKFLVRQNMLKVEKPRKIKIAKRIKLTSLNDRIITRL